MSLQVWLPLNQGPKSMVGDISTFGKESSVTITADTDGWYKIADSSHTSSRWGIYKDFYVKSNTTYTLTVYSKSTTGIATNIGIQSFNGYTAWPAQRDTNNTSTEKLTTYTWTTAATDNYARVYLAMNPGGTVANNYVFYKGVEILEAPEIRNQGLADVSAVNNGATYSSTDGKIGGCYSFNGSNSRIAINNVVVPSDSGSICCWFNASDVESADRYIIALNTSGGYVDQHFALYQYGAGVQFLVGGTTIYSTTISANTWYHMCITREGTTAKAYINGIQVGTSTGGSATGTNFCIGARCSSANGANIEAIYYFKGKINDVRVYSNTLSAKEVKKLSQGLVLHYPLNRKGFGQDNILINTHFDSRYSQTTGWDTTKNGTLMANSWGGYNSGVTNQATVYHAHLKEFNGEYVYEYIKTSDESWLGIAQSGLQSKMTAGKTYTFSWEEYHTQGTNRVGTGLYYFKPDAASANFHLGIQQKGDVSKTNMWQKCSYTFVAPTDADWSKNMSWYIYGHYNGNGTFYLRHIKLEEGSISTPWSPNSIDTFINLFDFNSTLEYDTSGFGNHGTKYGTFNYLSDTPKYNVSTNFTGTQYILSDSPTSEGVTLTAWIKTTNTNNQALIIDYKSGLGFGFWGGYIIPSSNSAIKTTYPVSAYNINQWNHIAIVKTSASSILCYINGISQTAGSTQDYWSANMADAFSVASRPNGTSPSTCQISDVRIYATALSAEDVLTLYNNKNF